MHTWLDVRLPSDSSAPGLARRALRDLPEKVQSRLATLQLLVSELVTNSVKHASLLGSDRIELIVRDAGHFVRVEVRDRGLGYEEALAAWKGVLDAPQQAEQLLPGGYGFLVVGGMADRSGLTWDVGTVAWFEIDYQRNGDRTSRP